MVSIVTPSYNQAAFLEQTLRSVLDQDYPKIEYLVADGASSDGSVELIKKYQDRLAWWVSEPDSGQADGINKGLRHARGEIVAWVNSDDYYLPGAISAAVKALQANPQAGMVYADAQAVDGNGQVTNLMKGAQWTLEDLMSFRIICQPTVFMRRSILEQAGTLDLAYHFLLDHQLWLRIAALAPLKYIPQTWAAARFHGAAKNVAQAARFGEEAYRILEWMENDLRYTVALAGCRSRAWAGAHRFNARYLQDAGQDARAWKVYWQGMRMDPAEVLPEWRRIAYIPLNRLGLGKLKDGYLRQRQQRVNRQK
jgi:glycosyltransferase involved in cell wall biosynthesis